MNDPIRGRFLELALPLSMILASCEERILEEQPDPRKDAKTSLDGHARMISVLAGLKESATVDHPYLNQKNLLYLKGLVGNLTPEVPLQTHWKVHFNLGLQEQLHGDDREAVARLGKALEIVDSNRHEFTSDHLHQTLFQAGMAWLRLGEAENCCALHTPEACILPFAPSALHQKPEGSRKAMEYFTRLAEVTSSDSPMHLRAIWLLNLAALTLDTLPDKFALPPDTFTARHPFPKFQNTASTLGLDTDSLSGGAVAEDFDNDGDLDLLVSGYAPDEQLRLYQNEGNGRFTETTEAANLTGLFGGLNLIQGDYDNDGFTDVLILRGAWFSKQGLAHPNSLLRNEGNGTFRDVTFEVGLGDEHFPTQTASWADFDLDGDLDLFIGNETTPGAPAPCQLFRNDGGETFTDIAAEAGVTNNSFTKAAVWGDFNHDRYPDLYLSNYFSGNRLYQNQRDGTFLDVATDLQVDAPVRSFPAWFWDFDNDGNLDLYVSAYAEPAIEHLAAEALGRDLQTDTQKLYRGDGKGGFTEVSLARQLQHPHNPMGANFGDLNADGFLDFYLGTGHPNYWELAPNAMYLNQQGESFINVSSSGGFGHLQKGHAVVFADFDNDGDQDVFEQMGGAVAADKFRDAFFENPGFGARWIKVKAIGTASNTSAIGTRITVHFFDQSGGARKVVRHVNSGGSFGANPLRQYFGLGQARAIERIEIFWPVTGKTQIIESPGFDQILTVTEARN